MGALLGSQIQGLSGSTVLKVQAPGKHALLHVRAGEYGGRKCEDTFISGAHTLLTSSSIQEPDGISLVSFFFIRFWLLGAS